MRGEIAFAKITGIADKFVEEVAMDMPLFPSPKRKYARGEHPLVRFFNSGIGVAMICGVVALGTLAAIVWAGRVAPPTPPVGTTAETETSVDAPQTEPSSESEDQTQAETTPAIEYSTQFDYVFGSGTAELAGYHGREEVVYTPPIANFWEESAPIIKVCNQAFRENTYIKEVYFAEGITEVGNEVFWGCKNLRRVVIPEGVTSIGCRVFVDCKSLSDVVLPQSLLHIGYDCFENSRLLKDKTLWHDGLFYIGDILIKADATQIKGNLVISDTTRVIAGSAFDGNKELTHVTIPGHVQAVGMYAFQNCANLSTLTIGEGVLYLDYGAFNQCKRLESVVIPESVISLGDSVFAECSSLKSVTIPQSITRLERHAFYGCESLESITLPDGLTYIGDEALAGTALTSVTIPASVQYLGYNVFSGCVNLKKVHFEGTQEEFKAIEKGYEAYYGYSWRSGTEIMSVVCSDGVIKFQYAP